MLKTYQKQFGKYITDSQKVFDNISCNIEHKLQRVYIYGKGSSGLLAG